MFRPLYSGQKKKAVTRDPRFDELSGTFQEKQFEKSYGFIKNMQNKEKKVGQSPSEHLIGISTLCFNIIGHSLLHLGRLRSF